MPAAEDAGELVGAAVGGVQGGPGGASSPETTAGQRGDQSAPAAAGRDRALPPDDLPRVWRAAAREWARRIGRSQVIELPPMWPVVVEAWQYAARCAGCGHRTKGSYPAGLELTRTFGPQIEALLTPSTSAITSATSGWSRREESSLFGSVQVLEPGFPGAEGNPRQACHAGVPADDRFRD